ncbi:MAG: FHA domain-containing protein [Gammaproteobacteria bacterium]|nr:FHA domain-containing protein [Gammaproteobacteria bacterium]
MQTKTCGRESSCDIVLENTGISPLHARIELADSGLVSVVDDESGNGTFLNRNDVWIRVRKVILCIGDRIRFGDVEVPIDRLLSVFGSESNARLEARHFAPRQVSSGATTFVKHHDHGPVLQKPRRNPKTGKIEEDHP